MNFGNADIRIYSCNVCMYLCIYVCIYGCMYVCIHNHRHETFFIPASLNVHMHACMCRTTALDLLCIFLSIFLHCFRYCCCNSFTIRQSTTAQT